jgi:biopolymer transport protein ExbD
MFERLAAARQKQAELDLLPVMNLFIVLIPFLLAAAAFYEVGVIATSVPQAATGMTDVERRTEAITLSVIIDADHVALEARNEALDPTALAGFAADLPAAGGAHDLAAVQAAAVRIKDAYPKSDTAIVLPAPTVRYDQLVRILDALREQDLGREQTRPLFPVTVFSKRLTVPADQGEQGDSPLLDVPQLPAADPLPTASPPAEQP